jgi:hypothetical protein
MMVHTCNPSSQEAEAGGWRVQESKFEVGLSYILSPLSKRGRREGRRRRKRGEGGERRKGG